jgi:hypothetical protein
LKPFTHTKKRAGGMAHGAGPEFKPQYYKKINNMNFFPWR